MTLNPQTQAELKRAVGRKAAALVRDGMLVGLGTGSTATFFIEHLIERVREGLRITAVSSSLRSADQARQGGIKVLDMNEVTSIDLTVDGADEIDPQDHMIKGGGGALLREKIVASSSHQVIIIVDESKLVPVLGTFGLPIEILPFGYQATIHKLAKLGYEGSLRMANQQPFITDNGHYIFDIHSPKTFSNPSQDHNRMIALAGVIETGFFFDLPIQVLVGYYDGSVAFRRSQHG
ncbi:MAG: ribose-5-phosphate isomerase RpiA [Verrucomicrobia bacterium]|nr:ribose-5-phosphate isomerase RpiA [Verrucomicrobiota bacterium]MBS0645823.1 ribose-5-phosphate isomerase RpiA [Verrucomicrobiota bacterium]